MGPTFASCDPTLSTWKLSTLTPPVCSWYQRGFCTLTPAPTDFTWTTSGFKSDVCWKPVFWSQCAWTVWFHQYLLPSNSSVVFLSGYREEIVAPTWETPSFSSSSNRWTADWRRRNLFRFILLLGCLTPHRVLFTPHISSNTYCVFRVYFLHCAM